MARGAFTLPLPIAKVRRCAGYGGCSPQHAA